MRITAGHGGMRGRPARGEPLGERDGKHRRAVLPMSPKVGMNPLNVQSYSQKLGNIRDYSGEKGHVGRIFAAFFCYDTGNVSGSSSHREVAMPVTSRPRQRTPAIPAARLPEVLDVHMTAQFLTVSADTVYDLFQRGDLPGRKVGRKWLTTKTLVLRWLEQSTKQSTEAQGDTTLAHAIANGDHHALVAAVHAGKARLGRKHLRTAR